MPGALRSWLLGNNSVVRVTEMRPAASGTHLGLAPTRYPSKQE